MRTDVLFHDLGLNEPLHRALEDAGYETPSPIQSESIPHLLTGGDLLGQAQTGTGKTAAFALPLLSRLDPALRAPQVLVLTPTRELAIQVCDAFRKYGKYLTGLSVLPVYGGASYSTQLRALRQGTQVVVGTPGRVMDHMRRGSLELDNLRALVLDEADEMLRMGFIDDVKWVLEHTPDNHQTALFSATMPRAISEVADACLKDPLHVRIQSKTTTATTITQQYWLMQGVHKFDALLRLVEFEDFDAMLVFVRTKEATVALAQKLTSAGFAAEALNGDISQAQRETIINRLRKGGVNILVGTDVVARGLDVERITHVINYDIPFDTEAYTHRIGRTGRAGRQGKAILFVAPREQRMLRNIERATRQPVEKIELPTARQINARRADNFFQQLDVAINDEGLGPYQKLMQDYFARHPDADPVQIMAALARMSRGGQPLFLQESVYKAERKPEKTDPLENERKPYDPKPRALKDYPEIPMVRYLLQVGRAHGIKPGNIVGCIANEAGIESDYIGDIELYEQFSTVDLPEGMPDDILRELKKARVGHRMLQIQIAGEKPVLMEAPESFRSPRKRPADKEFSDGRPGRKFAGKASKKGGGRAETGKPRSRVARHG
jgi:ATP-dependent RNA helicase DeaD